MTTALICTDPISRSVTLLGTYPESLSFPTPAPAIVRIEKTALPSFSQDLVGKTKAIERNDIVRLLWHIRLPQILMVTGDLVYVALWLAGVL